MKNPHWYPANWKELALACKERANWHCEHCNQHIPASGVPAISRSTGLCYRAYLQAAHKNHDSLNPNPELIALCPACHRIYDNNAKQKQKRLAYEIHRHRILLEKYREEKELQTVWQ